MEESEKKEPEAKPQNPEKNVTGSLRKNPWMTATFVLILLAIILVFGYSDFSITGKSVSEDDITQKVIDLVEAQGSDAELVEINSVSGLYEVVLIIDGKQTSVHVTKDGKYISSLMPFPDDSDLGNLNTNEDEQNQEDWTVFNNSLPEDMKNKILNFPTGITEDYNSDLRVTEFTNFEEITNTFFVLYNEGCGWCSKEYHVLVDLQEKYPDLEIYALDFSLNAEIAQKYNAKGTPANIINGKYFASGYRSLEDFEKILTELGY